MDNPEKPSSHILLKNIGYDLGKPGGYLDTKALKEMGKKGWSKQVWGLYEEAIEIYTDGLIKDPFDFGFYNNRCICYLELEDYEKAMKDAEMMIRLFRTNARSYYRKGQVLFKLQKYEEAEAFFKEVLKRDPNCEEARIQITEGRISHILRGGQKFSREQALQALNLTGNVEDARKALVNKTIEAHLKNLQGVIDVSDSEDGAQSLNKPKPKEYDPLQDPNNPYRSMSLWVGNIPEGVSVPFLMRLFSEYGKIKSVRPLYPAERSLGAAFINFYDSHSAGNAMKHLQGHLVRDKKLLIKYPHSVLPKNEPCTSGSVLPANASKKSRSVLPVNSSCTPRSVLPANTPRKPADAPRKDKCK